jgi:uncharacterized membrane protein/uncharacterized membrane protein YbhN (UPF0104 family)
MKSRLYSLVKFIIGFPLTLLALVIIIHIIASQKTTLAVSLHTLHIFMLLYGILCFIIYYYFRSYLWYRILRQYGYTIPFRETSHLWAMSELKRYIPGNIWSFLGRAVLFREKGVQKTHIAKGLIIEAELFVIGAVMISLLSLPFFFSSGQGSIEWLLLISVSAGVIIYCISSKLHLRATGKLRKAVSFLFSGFPAGENALLIFISIIALFCYGTGNYFVIGSVLYLTPYLFLKLIGIFAFAFVTGYLSIVTPAGFGVREGIVIFSLSKFLSYGLAAFGALFSRIILIVSELIFISVNTILYRLHAKRLIAFQSRIASHPQISILSSLSGIYFLYFTIVSFLRYDNFYAGRFDLGNMAQTVWNSLHGKIFLFTNPNGTEQISRLAYHADFILILLAPFYLIWENPKMLLLIQTGVLVAGAFFVYLLARDVLKNRNLGLAFAFSFLLNPSVQRTNIFDFHAVTLCTTFFLAMYYFFLKKRYVPFIIFALLAGLCKEQIWLIIGLFGLLVFFMHKKRLLGSILFLFSISMFYILIWYAIPRTLGAQHFALSYFSDFGDSPTQVVKDMILSPDKIISTVLEPDRLVYLNQLFLPVGYLAVLFPFFLIFAGPDLLINMLSNNSQLYQIYYQYTATITPFIFLCAIYAASWIRKITYPPLRLNPHRLNILITVYLISFSLFGAYFFGPLPGAADPNLDMFTRQITDRAFIDHYLYTIPKNDSVTASNALGSHLSFRENIYTIPFGIDKADVIVLLFTDPQSLQAYKQILKDPHYRLDVKRDNFVAFVKK